MSAEITAGHDGHAELVVQIRHENGVVSPVVLDGDTGLKLIAATGADNLQGLVGQPWRKILAHSVLGGT